MLKNRQYVPILKGKRGEFGALNAIGNKQLVVPLIEAVPSSPPEAVPQRVSAVWPNSNPYFIDLAFLDDDDLSALQASEHAIAACFNEAANLSQNAIPVTGLNRSPAYQTAVQTIVSQQGNGICVRLTPGDIADSSTLDGALTALSGFLGVGYSEIDIVIDTGSVFGLASAVLSVSYRVMLGMLPHINDWRSVVIAGSAFPQGVGAPMTAGWNIVDRVEWTAWSNLALNPNGIARIPVYSDYGISHPALPPTGYATILAQIRYTTGAEFLVFKGSDVFAHPAGFGQFHAICNDLINRPEYRGQAFSSGDQEIFEKATTPGSPGNAEAWRRIGTNHHIETVIDHLANLPSSSQFP